MPFEHYCSKKEVCVNLFLHWCPWVGRLLGWTITRWRWCSVVRSHWTEEQKTHPDSFRNEPKSQALWCSRVVPVFLWWKNRVWEEHLLPLFLGHPSIFEEEDHNLHTSHRHGWPSSDHPSIHLSVAAYNCLNSHLWSWLATCPGCTPAFRPKRVGIGSTRPPWPWIGLNGYR